jgi:hypothetical protein
MCKLSEVNGYAIHCSFYHQTVELFKALHKLGYTWNTGASLTGDTHYFTHNRFTVYLLMPDKTIMYSNLLAYNKRRDEFKGIKHFHDITLEE